MDATAELGRNPVTKYQIQPEYRDAGRRGTGLLNPSRETRFSGANGDRKISFFLFSSDHERDWQPYPVDAYPCYM